MGGLARKGTLVARARAEADGVVVVDAGGALAPASLNLPGYVEPEPSELVRRARLIMGGMARIGIHAFSPSIHDLRVGPAKLIKLGREFGVPIVSANIVDGRGKPAFETHRIVEVAGVKVGLFGVCRNGPEDKEAWQAMKLAATDSVAAAGAAVKALRNEGAQVIVALLYLGSRPDVQKLVTAVPGIDIAVMGGTNLTLKQPDMEGTTRLVEAHKMGKYLGRMDLHVVDGDFEFADRGARAQLLVNQDETRRQIESVRKGADGDKSGKLAAHYERRLKALNEALARNQADLAKQPARIEGSWLENRLFELDTSVPDDPAVAVMVQLYNEETQRLAKAGKRTGVKPIAARLADNVALVPPKDPPKEEPLRYAGVVSCQGCHATQYAQWKTTKHARALVTLTRKKRDADPSCVVCHVTGFLRPAGTRDLTLATGRLRDVGCEACHGPGADHISAEGKGHIARLVGQEICVGCHTPDQVDGDFDYDVFVKAILGPGHGGPAPGGAGQAGPGAGG